jgi:hypothetical protein
MSGEDQKLRRLRARTDRDLLIVLRHEVERALVLVDTAGTRRSSVFARAAMTYVTARVLIGTVASADRALIERRVDALGRRLDQVPATRSYAASFAA